MSFIESQGVDLFRTLYSQCCCEYYFVTGAQNDRCTRMRTKLYAGNQNRDLSWFCSATGRRVNFGNQQTTEGVLYCDQLLSHH